MNENSRKIFVQKLKEKEATLDRMTIKQQLERTRLFIQSIPKPTVHVFESQQETFETKPLSKQSRPKFDHVAHSVIIDGDSLGKCFQLAHDKMTWKFFSCQGVTIGMKEALKYPIISN